jgi:phosphatidylethanolamine/phosphatidyl-N-methylethanolamine N-methyltransferase
MNLQRKQHASDGPGEAGQAGVWPNRHGFLQKFLRDPERIGALAPATLRLAQTIALATHEAYRNQSAIAGDPSTPLRLVELGAGTGALTRTMSILNPVLVERDEAWAALLRQQFPYLEVRTECATHTLHCLTEPIGIVTSIPLLNNPQGVEIKRLLARKYADGLIKFCVLYTYGWTNPLKGARFRSGYRSSFVAMSLPPASVWVYQ